MTRTWLLDLDGVLWRGSDAIPGAAQAVQALRQAGVTVAFFTNNSLPSLADQLAKLASFGVDASESELLSSSQAAAGLLLPGERVLAGGGPGLYEALVTRGVEVTLVTDLLGPLDRCEGTARLQAIDALEVPDVDAVVIGLDPGFAYSGFSVLARAIASGARLVATNDDATYPSALGMLPGCGSLLAAIQVASGASGVVAGKPHGPAAALVAARLGPVEMVVGDRPETDGLLARRVGARFGLVCSGVTEQAHGALDPAPDVEAADLGALVAAELGR